MLQRRGSKRSSSTGLTRYLGDVKLSFEQEDALSLSRCAPSGPAKGPAKESPVGGRRRRKLKVGIDEARAALVKAPSGLPPAFELPELRPRKGRRESAPAAPVAHTLELPMPQQGPITRARAGSVAVPLPLEVTERAGVEREGQPLTARRIGRSPSEVGLST